MPEIRGFLDAGLMIDPWLANLEEQHVTGEAESILRKAAREIGEGVDDAFLAREFRDLPVTSRYLGNVFLETLISTAAYRAHLQHGGQLVDAGLAHEAVRLASSYIYHFGLGALVAVYVVVTAYENQQAVSYYGGIPEREFVRGVRHRPWVSRDLEDELVVGVALGTYRLTVEEGRRIVRLTKRGENRLDTLHRILEESGYTERHRQIMYLSQFDIALDWDSLVDRVLPEMNARRREFVAFAGVRPGWRVLDIGTANASLIFEGGMLEAVGPAGEVVGLDPSAGMLSRAMARPGAPNLSFMRGTVEKMPFPDGHFDAALSFGVLHFAKPPEAFAEMRRVTRPGGVVAAMVPLQFDASTPFFREWFAPVLALAKNRERPGNILREGELTGWFRQYGLRDVVTEIWWVAWLFPEVDSTIRYLVETVGYFQAVLERMPWQARTELIEELRRRGAAVMKKYPAAERRIMVPLEVVRARTAE